LDNYIHQLAQTGIALPRFLAIETNNEERYGHKQNNPLSQTIDITPTLNSDFTCNIKNPLSKKRTRHRAEKVK